METIIRKAAAVLMAAAVAFTSVSCQDETDVPGIGNKQKVSLTVDVLSRDIATKAELNEAGESTINKVEVFVFNSDAKGRLDVYGSTDGATELTLNCTTGQKDIYALANGNISAEVLKTIDTKQKFLSAVSLLSANTATDMEMIGYTSQNIAADSQIQMGVSRLVARIGIKKIITAFTSPAHKNMEFKINGIYIVNAVSKATYDMNFKPSQPADFSNFKELMGQYPSFLSASVSAPLANGSALDANQYFYVLPNLTEEDCQDSSDNPRYTRLVVEANLGGTVYYYPISIVGENGILENNKAYTINSLTITRPGSLSPDVPFSIAENPVSLSVTEWDETADDRVI